MSRRIFTLVALAAALAGCGGGPVVPDWQANAHAALAAHLQAYLVGRDRVAAAELAVARREVGRTGEAATMAQVELAACAARFASLAAEGCPAFHPLAGDAGPAANAYAAYLAGPLPATAVPLLPPAQQAVARGAGEGALAAIDDPLSRLVAAAALLRQGRLSPAGITVAIDTAAAQGWRRPLLAWLGVDRDRRRAAGEEAGAQHQQRRMDRLLGTPAPR